MTGMVVSMIMIRLAVTTTMISKAWFRAKVISDGRRTRIRRGTEYNLQTFSYRAVTLAVWTCRVVVQNNVNP